MVITEEEEKRQDELEKRKKAQEERILKQRGAELNRVSEAKERAEQRLPLTEEQKIGEEKQLTTRSGKILTQSSKWDRVWARRQAKWNSRKRKIG